MFARPLWLVPGQSEDLSLQQFSMSAWCLVGRQNFGIHPTLDGADTYAQCLGGLKRAQVLRILIHGAGLVRFNQACQPLF